MSTTDEIMELSDAYAEASSNYSAGLDQLIDTPDPLHSRAALFKAVEALEADAARYRRLRSYLPSDDTSRDDAIVACTNPEQVDAAIDAAMQKGTP